MTPLDVAKEWIARWGKPDSAAFAELYADDGAYVDPAFGLLRKGRQRIQMHHHLWWKAIPDFELRAEQFHVAGRVVVVQFSAEGTFSGEDLGGGRVKATQRRFRGRSIAVLEFDDEMKIKKCTEYYDRSILPGGEPTLFNDTGDD